MQVNGVPHQVARKVEGRLRDDPQYAIPYERIVHGSPGNVLVVGAGTGNDVALALARGAEHVDAVEIDPKILDLGRRHHPDRPYQDPRVTTHVDDGRAFLERTKSRYDLDALRPSGLDSRSSRAAERSASRATSSPARRWPRCAVT